MSAHITKEVVAKVARLARLNLTLGEIEKMTSQLSGMLDHFSDIDALDLKDIAPMAQPYELKNVYREDEVAPSLDRQEVLSQAPHSEGGRFRVPPIIGLDV